MSEHLANHNTPDQSELDTKSLEALQFIRDMKYAEYLEAEIALQRNQNPAADMSNLEKELLLVNDKLDAGGMPYDDRDKIAFADRQRSRKPSTYDTPE